MQRGASIPKPCQNPSSLQLMRKGCVLFSFPFFLHKCYIFQPFASVHGSICAMCLVLGKLVSVKKYLRNLFGECRRPLNTLPHRENKYEVEALQLLARTERTVSKLITLLDLMFLWIPV